MQNHSVPSNSGFLTFTHVFWVWWNDSSHFVPLQKTTSPSSSCFFGSHLFTMMYAAVTFARQAASSSSPCVMEICRVSPSILAHIFYTKKRYCVAKSGRKQGEDEQKSQQNPPPPKEKKNTQLASAMLSKAAKMPSSGSCISCSLERLWVTIQFHFELQQLHSRLPAIHPCREWSYTL